MKTILVIEDEKTIRTNILKILEYKGFQTIGAENGEIGLQLARTHLPDLILCDVMMPERDGYSVLEALQEDPDTASIPFIFLTAKSDLSDVRRGMNLGADDYIPKPFTSQDLVETIQVRLTKKDALTQPYVDQMREAAEALGRAAYVDLLTGLPNRIGLNRNLRLALSQAKQHEQRIAVICLAIEGLERANDDLGYMAGDLLLRAIAERLKACTGSSQQVARLSGEQFVVFIGDLQSVEEALAWVHRIQATLAEPYAIQGRQLGQDIRLGLSLYPDHGDRAELLVVCAETALRWGRQHATENYQLYAPSIDAEERDRQQLSQDLKAVSLNDEFFLLYQPQVNLITNRIIGVEAFLRWRHPGRGLIAPQKFVPLMEELGMMDDLSQWGLQMACQQAARFQTLSLVPISMAVNLSTLQFRHPNLLQVIQKIVEDTRLDPQLLVLELTEHSLIGEQESIRHTLMALKDIGVRIAIDDFGMGYSSLKYLGQFPIDVLKIDRFFIQQIEDEHYTAVVSSIIAIAQTLKLKVIAEGVETESQLAILRKYGCHAMQGHFHSVPLSAQAIETVLREANA